MSGAAGPGPDDFKMSLMEHLTELRSRLLRVTLAVLALGGASLVFARELYGLLMRPVLSALPAEAPSLVYTSAIEELNVLMKIGLYAGLFMSTPVVLHQAWAFVAPGLYETERKLALPFVTTGTVAFLSGVAFCYFVVLPSMFEFLLQREDVSALEARYDVAATREREALRFARMGALERAGILAREGTGLLGGQATSLRGWGGDGAVLGLAHTPTAPEVRASLEGLGRLIDALAAGRVPSGAAVLLAVLERRLEALRALERGEPAKAAQLADDAAAQLAGVVPGTASELADLWKLERRLAQQRATIDAANWTRPMLSMSEQLTLVLVLELAFGIIFELPLVMMLLGMAGLISSKFLFRYQRHAFVVCLVLAALVTPTGDAVNLALMAGPMLLCYELGVLLVWLVERRRRRAAAAEV